MIRSGRSSTDRGSKPRKGAFSGSTERLARSTSSWLSMPQAYTIDFPLSRPRVKSRRSPLDIRASKTTLPALPFSFLTRSPASQSPEARNSSFSRTLASSDRSRRSSCRLRVSFTRTAYSPPDMFVC